MRTFAIRAQRTPISTGVVRFPASKRLISGLRLELPCIMRHLTRSSVRSLIALASLGAATFTSVQAAIVWQEPPAAETAPATSSPYARVVEAEEGKRLNLELSSRAFVSPKGGPVVHLVGAVHIGDEAYYQSLQKFLDEQELVLFEGVKPAGTSSDLGNADDAAKVKLTKSRQRMLAIMIERHKRKHGAYPASLEELQSKMLGAAARLAASASKDAWGQPQTYVTKGSPIESFDLTSLGSDKADGGEAAAADLKFSDQKPLTKKEKNAAGEGIQVQLAEALGLKFQLAAIDYTRPTWRNSDMSIDQVQQRLEASGASGDALFSMLDGSSLASRFVSMMLGFVKGNPQMAMMMKIMLVETLANSDEMIGSQAGGENLAALMKVIVVDRNQEVFNDLAKVLADEPGMKSIAIFYGAGHLADMEKRLTKDMGFVFRDDRWFTAMSLDLSSQPGAMAQARGMRASFRKMAEQRRKAADQE